MFCEKSNGKCQTEHLMLAAIVLFVLLPSCLCEGKDDIAANSEPGVVKAHWRGLHGYIGYSAARPSDRLNYSSGMG